MPAIPPPSSLASSSKSTTSASTNKPNSNPPPAAKSKAKAPVGSNWAALKKTIASSSDRPAGSSSSAGAGKQDKKRKRKEAEGSLVGFVKPGDVVLRPSAVAETSYKRGRTGTSTLTPTGTADGDSSVPAKASASFDMSRVSPLVTELRNMVLEEKDFVGTKAAPGKFLAIDCEMVGVGPEGAESSLARVSIVNFHGAIVLDTFVRQKEKVVDYRTWVSGVSASDLIGAPTFEDVQKQVSDLIDGKTLVGHAIKNDFDALLLSHPRQLVRDTQTCPDLRKAAGGTKHPGLKKLALIELGVEIQSGRHSSVVDARATMALYRLHKDTWEKTLPSAHAVLASMRKKTGEAVSYPGGGRKGISSGLGTVVRGGGTGGKREKVAGAGGGGGSVEAGGGGGGGGGNWWEDE